METPGNLRSGLYRYHDRRIYLQEESKYHGLCLLSCFALCRHQPDRYRIQKNGSHLHSGVTSFNGYAAENAMTVKKRV